MLALVVADDLLHRDSLSAMLIALAGADTTDAVDCEAARRVMAAVQPDLMLVDGALPQDEVRCLVEEATQRRPPVRCAVLRVELSQRAALEEAGAGFIVPEGEPPERFFDQMAQWFAAGQAAAS